MQQTSILLFDDEEPKQQRLKLQLRRQDIIQFDSVMSDDEINDEIIRSRNEDIRFIEEQLTDLCEIQSHIGMMILNQREKIEVCEEHVVDASANVKEATVNLSTASSYKSKIRGTLVGAGAVFGTVALGGLGIAFWLPIAGIIAGGIGITGVAATVGMAVKLK